MNKENAKDYLPLVQAMAEGKTIQEWSSCQNLWYDVDVIECSRKPARYRIKPDPREIWVKESPFGESVIHRNEMIAKEKLLEGDVIRRYREVIE